MTVPVIATRVMLLFKSDESDEDIVKAFLRQTNRPESQYESNEHFIHLDPDRTADSNIELNITHQLNFITILLLATRTTSHLR